MNFSQTPSTICPEQTFNPYMGQNRKHNYSTHSDMQQHQQQIGQKKVGYDSPDFDKIFSNNPIPEANQNDSHTVNGGHNKTEKKVDHFSFIQDMMKKK